MGLIVYLNKNNVIFDRIQFSTEEILEERWNINFPMNSSNFNYKFDKMNNKIKPFFDNKYRIKIKIINKKNFNKKILIIFKAAFHQDYVYKYKIILKNREKQENNRIYYFYSDYYKSKKNRQKILIYMLLILLVILVNQKKKLLIYKFYNLSFIIKYLYS